MSPTSDSKTRSASPPPTGSAMRATRRPLRSCHRHRFADKRQHPKLMSIVSARNPRTSLISRPADVDALPSVGAEASTSSRAPVRRWTSSTGPSPGCGAASKGIPVTVPDINDESEIPDTDRRVSGRPFPKTGRGSGRNQRLGRRL
jgi:hypothetical protein